MGDVPSPRPLVLAPAAPSCGLRRRRVGSSPSRRRDPWRRPPRTSLPQWSRFRCPLPPLLTPPLVGCCCRHRFGRSLRRRRRLHRRRVPTPLPLPPNFHFQIETRPRCPVVILSRPSPL